MAERCLAARPVERQISSQFGYSFREFTFMTISPADVQTARRILAGAALRTPMLPSPKLSGLTGAEVFVKYENLQVTNSFKDRGAYVKLASLSEAQRRRGVIAMSIGNHAKAVAYHSQRLGIPATIVMPVTTPSAKVKDTEAYGAKVVLDGETLGECQKRAVAIARDHALILVPPMTIQPSSLDRAPSRSKCSRRSAI
jgi:threonine dehydratase